MKTKEQLQKRIKYLLLFFIAALILSGITAFPLEWEMSILNYWVGKLGIEGPLQEWLSRVYTGLAEINQKYPFVAYGTDWLAFAHIVIGVAFIGPLRDPVKNIWVIEFGMIACVMVLPLALIAGSIREIPFYWRLIDCSFGVFGILPLLLCRRYIKELEALS
ncbi:MAG: hypothetical protein GY754_40920 [bacterium]|nr:hypothetical protein [bacterium]